ncbi:phage tail protein [Embleya sp. NPDC050493]|uniref:phage tail protein n=1 Tax=Embleya sp. NPDC050493 TaxID=3363989 RepID=UPI0037909F1A
MSGATGYRWVNALGRWPGARFEGVRTDGERVVLSPGTAVLEPLAVADLDPAGGPLGLVVPGDGTVLVADPGHGRVLRVDGCDHTVCVLGCLDVATGDPAALRRPRGLWLLDGGRLLVVGDEPGDGRPVRAGRARGMVVCADTGEYLTPWTDPPPAEDPVLRAARERIGGLAAIRGPDGVLVVGGVRQRPGPGLVLVPDDGSPARVLAVGDLAGIAIDRCGRVFVAGPGGIARQGARRTGTRGIVVLPAPIEPPGIEHWDRVRVLLAEPAPPGTHVRLWTMRASTGGPPESPDPASADADDAPVPTAPGRWRAGPLDGLDVRVLSAPAAPGARLWIAVELLGDGSGTPRVDDVRVEHVGRGLLDALPAAYTGDDDGSGTLGRLLGLLAGAHEASVRALEELPASLDPGSAPDRPDDPWLERLAGWVDVAPSRSADPATRRADVAGAYAAHGRRGTPAGLIAAVARETGVRVRLSEPLLEAGIWRLGSGGLGRDTAVHVADPGPPVLDATAVLDGAHLVSAQERGLPLYAAFAHRVCVHVPPEHADALPEIAHVVERERPAHVFARVRVERPGAIPGLVGVDTRVAGPPPARAAGAGTALGTGIRLPGPAAAHVGGPLGARLDTTLPTPGGRGSTTGPSPRG